VVCDRSKLDGKRCNGAPDMIIEILSPNSAKRDLIIKFNKYQQAGVREYWVVNPDNKIVSVHILENGKYVTSAYSDTDTVSVHVLDGCEIDLREVLEEE
jgi:Uma2 family endonuclease